MRRMLASLLIVVAACGGTEPTPPVDPGPVSTPGKIIDRAQSVADQANQRTADLESVLGDG